MMNPSIAKQMNDFLRIYPFKHRNTKHSQKNIIETLTFHRNKFRLSFGRKRNNYVYCDSTKHIENYISPMVLPISLIKKRQLAFGKPRMIINKFTNLDFQPTTASMKNAKRRCISISDTVDYRKSNDSNQNEKRNVLCESYFIKERNKLQDIINQANNFFNIKKVNPCIKATKIKQSFFNLEKRYPIKSLVGSLDNKSKVKSSIRESKGKIGILGIYERAQNEKNDIKITNCKNTSIILNTQFNNQKNANSNYISSIIKDENLVLSNSDSNDSLENILVPKYINTKISSIEENVR